MEADAPTPGQRSEPRFAPSGQRGQRLAPRH